MINVTVNKFHTNFHFTEKSNANTRSIIRNKGELSWTVLVPGDMELMAMYSYLLHGIPAKGVTEHAGVIKKHSSCAFWVTITFLLHHRLSDVGGKAPVNHQSSKGISPLTCLLSTALVISHKVATASSKY